MLKSRNSACFSAGTKLSGLFTVHFNPGIPISIKAINFHKFQVYEQYENNY